MKSTKTLLIAALAAGALLVGSSSLLAQDSPNTPPPGLKGKKHDPAEALNLTEDQKPKFKEVMKDAMDQRKALREDTSLSAEEKKAKGKAIQEETSTKMKALLTPEQYTKWQEMAKKGHRGGPAAGGAGAPPSKD